MEKSASTIGKKKFQRLSIRQQHKVLVRLAEQALAVEQQQVPFFEKRYHELHSWAELDRFTGAPWLTSLEFWQDCAAFHSGFTGVEQSKRTNTPPPTWQARFPVQIVLDQVRSAYNVGSILRLIDNFGFASLVHASPWLNTAHPQLRKAARGTESWIPIQLEEDLPSFLRTIPGEVVGIEIDAQAIPLTNWCPAYETTFVLGNETYGISKTIRNCCDTFIQIPMFGYKRSMNVSHALTAAAYYWHEKHQLPKKELL